MHPCLKHRELPTLLVEVVVEEAVVAEMVDEEGVVHEEEAVLRLTREVALQILDQPGCGAVTMRLSYICSLQSNIFQHTPNSYKEIYSANHFC